MTSTATGRGFTAQLLLLLRTYAEKRASGLLTLRSKRGTKKVFFHEGDLVAVASAEAGERLGNYLVGWGFVSAAQLDKLLEDQRSDARGLGELAVARRILDREAMCRLLRIRAEDALFDLARWEHAEFHFAPVPDLGRAYLELRLPVKALLADLERLVAAWRLIGERVPGRQDVPVVELPQEFRTLSMTEADVLRLVDGRRSLAEVANTCRISQLEVSMVLHQHARDGLVRFSYRAEPAAASLGWPELLREAETALALADLIEAHNHLCRALATGDTSRELQERALEIEERLRAALSVSENDTPRVAGAVADRTTLAAEELALLELVDGHRELREILDRLGGDRMRNLLVAQALVQCGILALAAPAAARS
jgi:hypothetical protein